MRLLYRVRFRRDHGWAPDHMSEYPRRRAGARRARAHGAPRARLPGVRRLLAGLRAVVDGLGRLPAPGGGADAAQIAAAVRGRLDEPPAS